MNQVEHIFYNQDGYDRHIEIEIGKYILSIPGENYISQANNVVILVLPSNDMEIPIYHKQTIHDNKLEALKSEFKYRRRDGKD